MFYKFFFKKTGTQHTTDSLLRSCGLSLLILIPGMLLVSGGYAQQGPPNPVETDTLAPFVTSTSISAVTASTATLGGNVTGNGGAVVTERGVVYSNINNQPTVADTKVIIGNGNGPYSQVVTGLKGGTTYFVRAYAINIIGTSYGAVVSFTTDASPPVVTTSEVASIGNTTATVGGDISYTGGAAVTERGVVYSTANNPPTVSDTKLQIGSGTGSFSQSLTGLTQGALYYLRAYAINSAGISYGSTVGFTPAGATVSTDNITGITTGSALLGGNVSSVGTSPVTEKGIVYLTGSGQPTLTDTKIVMGAGAGSFSQTVSGLAPATTYSVRAFATNGSATNYGTVQTFTTQTNINAITRVGSILTNSNVITFSVVFAQPVTGLSISNFSLTTTGVNNSYLTAVRGSGTDWIVTAYSGTGNGTITLNLANSTGVFPGINNSLPFVGETFNIDRVSPSLSLVSISSDNTDTTLAKPGDTVKLVFLGNEQLASTVVTIDGKPAPVVVSGNNTLVAGYQMTTAESEGVIPFSIQFSDVAGNTGTTTQSTTNSSSVRFDKTAPVISSITATGTTPTAAGSVQYTVTFSESVTGVDAADFSLNATNSLAGYSVSSVSGNGAIYTVTVNTGSGSGFLRLDVKNNGTGIADLAGNVLANGFSTGQAYSIQRKPFVVITNPVTVCVPQMIDLTAAAVTTGSDTSLAYTYFTNAAATAPLTGPAAIAVSGTYYIVGTNSLGGSSDPMPVTVTIDSPVPAVRLQTVNANNNDPVQLQARNIGTAFNWSPITGLSSSTVANPTATINQEIQYTIRMTMASGCVTVDTMLVRVFDKHLYVPNVFSPNNDGINDILLINTIRIQSFHFFRVFNRYGKMVFETDNASRGWDGKWNGQLQPVDTYVWVAEAKDNNGVQVNAQGTVTLLR